MSHVLLNDVPRKRKKQNGHPVLTDVTLLPPSLSNRCIWSRHKNAHPSLHNQPCKGKPCVFKLQLQPAWLSLLPWGLTFISLLTCAVWLKQSFTVGLDLYARLIHFSYRLAEIWCLPPGLSFAVNLSGFLHRKVGCEKCQFQQFPSWSLFGLTLWILAVSVAPAKQGDCLGFSGLQGLLSCWCEGIAWGTVWVVFIHWGKIDLYKEHFTSLPFSLLQATQRSRLQSLYLYWWGGKTRSYGEEKTSGDRWPSWAGCCGAGCLSRQAARGIA